MKLSKIIKGMRSLNILNFEDYNIEVENNHNYLITEEEILVHNKQHNGGF